MSAETFNPRALVAAMGATVTTAVTLAADGKPWTFATLYAAADALRSTRPRLAKRLHDLGATWAVLHREVRA